MTAGNVFPDPVVFFTAYIREHGAQWGQKIPAIRAYRDHCFEVIWNVSMCDPCARAERIEK